jgi:PAS domain S-box-containing protein
MNNRLRVLLVEDSEDDAALLLRQLKRGGYDVTYERVYTADAMRAALAGQTWDIVLSDYSMPSFNAPGALAVLHESGIDLPFIISSGTIGEETAVSALQAGAHDFIMKDNLARLIPAIERELRDAQMRRERKEAEAELRALYNATSVLFKADNLNTLGQEIVRAVVQEFKQADCGLIMVDKDQNNLVRLARAGQYSVPTEAVLSIDGLGLVPEALRKQEMIYVGDVLADPRYVSNNPDTRSELVVPLQTAKRVLGVLDLQSPHPHGFSERDRRILSAFAERVAAALEIRQLYEEINGYAGELESRVAVRTAELHRAKEHVEAIFNNSSDAIILVRADGRIKQNNPAFCALFGYTDEEAVGQPLTILATDEYIAEFQKTFERIVVTNQPERIELVGHHKDKTQFTFEMALAPFMEDEASVICSLRDVTHRKQLEQELRDALTKEKELSEMKSRFSSMVSHEFRTPLATIQSSTDLLNRYGAQLNEEQKTGHLIKIQAQVQHLTNLLENILTISRSEALTLEFHPAWLDLEALCREVVLDMQLIAAQHEIVFSTKGMCGRVLLDGNLIRQVIANLLSNAVKYSPSGTKILLDLICEGNSITICVEDNGIGIPDEDRKYLFESFHRAANVGSIAGTGLGLAIVKQVIDQHKGTIQVESKLGNGTKFTINLPIDPAAS